MRWSARCRRPAAGSASPACVRCCAPRACSPRRRPAEPSAPPSVEPLPVPPESLLSADPLCPTCPGVRLRIATPADLPLILGYIRALADYARLSDQVVADEALLDAHLFGERPAAEVLLAELDGAPAGFALYFTSFSTFLGRPGIYLEDLWVEPACRRRGVARTLLVALARLALARGCG
ncbi:MAG: GNAT family N-acetyltransferase, partial [Proteobacteria bacterium]|nr:GNAT family N-acetyltransferase [Pseudomonadota bacterium]